MSAVLPVLLWEQLAVAPVAGGAPATALLGTTDPVTAFCAFLEQLTPTPHAIRLLYQGPALESVPTPCPRNARRRLLQQVLAAKYPALAMPATAWAAHPPRAGAGGATTLLYISQNPFLSQLQAALAARQIRLEAAYPVFVAAEAGPPFAPGDNPAMALLHADHGFGVFWVSPGGDRYVSFFTGPAAPERMQQALATGFSIFEGRFRPPLLLIQAAAAPPAPGLLPQPATQTLSVDAFLAATRPLPPLANLLPVPSRFSLPRLLLLTALALLVATLLLGYQYLAARHQARANLALQQAQIQLLVAETSRLETNQARIERLEAFLAELAGGPRSKGRFLAALGRARPAQITLRSVVLNESTWSVSGLLHEGLDQPQGPYEDFLRDLFKEPGWSPGPDSRSPRSKSPEFTLGGRFP